MKKTNKLWLALLLTVLVAALLAVGLTASAEETPAVVASGYCGGEDDGTNLVWALDNDGTLTISGTGAMKGYGGSDIPWNPVNESIRAVVVETGVTHIGSWAFYNCTNLTKAVISEGITFMGDDAFRGCRSLKEVVLPAKLDKNA